MSTFIIWSNTSNHWLCHLKPQGNAHEGSSVNDQLLAHVCPRFVTLSRSGSEILDLYCSKQPPLPFQPTWYQRPLLYHTRSDSAPRWPAHWPFIGTMHHLSSVHTYTYYQLSAPGHFAQAVLYTLTSGSLVSFPVNALAPGGLYPALDVSYCEFVNA